MAKIKCQNCGFEEDFSKDERCSNCNIKLYGYNINNLPQQYRNIINNPSYSKPTNNPKPTDNPKPIDKPNKPMSQNRVGWFVIHTEGKKQDVFKLKDGINYIGRAIENHHPDINVKNDKYVSKGHAHIMVKNINGAYEYTLFDNQNNQTGKPSLNGTYVNGNPTRLNQSNLGCKITDGDTIQIGETKLVIKTPNTTNDDLQAKTIVSKMDFTKTIVIN